MTCLGQTTLLLFEEYTAEGFTSLRTNSSSVCKAYYVNFFILFLASSSPVHFNHRLSLTRNTTTAANHGKGTHYKVLSSPNEDNVRLKDFPSLWATWTHESRICPLYTTRTYALQGLAEEQMNLNKCTLNNSRMQFLAHLRTPPDNSWMNAKLSKLWQDVIVELWVSKKGSQRASPLNERMSRVLRMSFCIEKLS